jgi:hypothetical protein
VESGKSEQNLQSERKKVQEFLVQQQKQQEMQ